MPQVFQALRCYKCLTFQVHQTKKSNKWECKLCGEKQSIKRHYGIGTAKDCRIHVQKLNSMRGEVDELKCGQMSNNLQSFEEYEDEELEISPKAQVTPQLQPVNSKWSNYVEVSEPIEEMGNEPMCLGDAEVVLEIAKKRRKHLSNYCKSTKNSSSVVSTTDSREHDYNTNDKVYKPSYYDTQGREPINHPNEKDHKASFVGILSENKIDKKNTKSNAIHKKFIPPVINKDSKWAGFLEDEVPDITSTDEAPETISTSSDVLQNNQIFSLCNDSELDSVLNI